MKAAVICSKGIGDGLMMMVASHRLNLEGYEVTTFQDSLHQLAPLFPGHHFAKQKAATKLHEFDLIILQNDNSPLSFQIINTYRPKLSVFYASYEANKHPPLTSMDRVFNRKNTLTQNIAEAIASVLQSDEVFKSNGIVIPQNLIHRKYPKRILIHPTSTTPKRTYLAKKFLKVAEILKKKGYQVAFCVSLDERKTWIPLVQDRFLLPEFPSLKHLATYIYESYFLIGNESGTGHLASNLGIPTLIVASCPKQMALWRPCFLPGKVLTPPSYIPNFKGLRLRENQWQYFISPRRIIREMFR
jgi:heptosyltransferase III